MFDEANGDQLVVFWGMWQGGDCPLSCMESAGPVLFQTHPEGNAFRKWNGMFNSAGTDYHTLAKPSKHKHGSCLYSPQIYVQWAGAKIQKKTLKKLNHAPCVPHATTQKRQESSAFFSGIPMC